MNEGVILMELAEYRRKAMAMLGSYRDNQVQIKVLEADLEAVSLMINTNMAVSYDQPSGGRTYKITSVVENEVIDRDSKRQALSNEITRLRNQIQRVDIALGNMPLAQRTLLKLKFIDKLYWKQVCQHIAYSEDYIRKELKESAIDMLTGYLFPQLGNINLFADQYENPHSTPHRQVNDVL